MPWPDKQRRAIAASLARQGKSREEIRAFFHKHGHGGSNHPMMRAARRKRK